MRRTLIQNVLPLVFCAVPVLATLLIVVALPGMAREYYIRQVFIQKSPMDWLILILGLVLFAFQMELTWQALQWRGTRFDERPDRWLSHLAQAAEWFPLLGLIGTVAAILQTFTAVAAMTSPDAKTIIEKYGPAITATGSGLFMALINILPTWIVAVGRDLIAALAGSPRPADAPGEG